MTKPPRTRPGQRYPGGKALRRAYDSLYRRTHGKQNGKRPDRINALGEEIPWGNYGFTKPGTMKA